MIVANFLNLEREPVNVEVTFSEWILYIFNQKKFLDNLSIKWEKDFVSQHYFGGGRFVILQQQWWK